MYKLLFFSYLLFITLLSSNYIIYQGDLLYIISLSDRILLHNLPIKKFSVDNKYDLVITFESIS